MSKAWVIAVREYLALVATKAFILGLLVGPLMIGLAFLVVGDDDDADADVPKVIAVADHSGTVLPQLEASLKTGGYRVQTEPPETFDDSRRLALAEEVRDGELFAIVEIGSAAAAAGPDTEANQTRIYVENVAANAARWLDTMTTTAVQLSRMSALGISERDAAALMQEVDVERRPLPTADGEVSGDAALVQTLAPIIIVALVFMAVMTAASPLLQAVIEEKQQRIAEVLLGAVSPLQLMTGKLLGAVGIVLTTLLFYVGLGWATAAYMGYADYVPVGALGIAVLAAAVGSILFGGIFLALGAAANELKDAQSLMTPVIILLFGPLMVLGTIMENPHSSLAVGASLFPFTAPILMPMRLVISDLVPAWQVALAFVLTLATTVGVLWAAGRVFRIGILSQGKTPTFGELLQWLRA